MPTVVHQFSFSVRPNPACWTGAPSAFELELVRPLPNLALEALRVRVFAAVTTTRAPAPSARAILQMAFETEIRAALTKLIKVAPDVMAAQVCERRSYLDVDADLRGYAFLLEPALEALGSGVPAGYVRLVRRYLGSGYARYRVSATCALLCLAAATSLRENGTSP
jgi:hypothetical protein